MRFAAASTEAWRWTRILFGLAGLAEWLPRARHVVELYSAAGVPIVGSRYSIGEWVMWSPTSAWLIWGLCVLALGAIVFGFATRIALLVFLVASCALMFAEALHVKAYDRLMAWQALVMVFGPWKHRPRDPPRAEARYMLMVVYATIYGCTGLSKLLSGSAWWTGEALSYFFVGNFVGGLPLGVLLSRVPWLVAILAWFTMVFESSFALLVWLRRTNPWILAAGVVFHIGILLMMDVSAFSVVSIAAYPVLLHPEAWTRLSERAGGLRARIAQRIRQRTGQGPSERLSRTG